MIRPLHALRLVPALLVLATQLGCGGVGPRRKPFEQVRRDSASLRSQAIEKLDAALIYPDCSKIPEPATPCGLIATRDVERAIVKKCAGKRDCLYREVGALYSKVADKAENYGVQLDAVGLRCGEACLDVRQLELEVLATHARNVESSSRAVVQRADADEGSAAEREDKTPQFEKERSVRNDDVNAKVKAHTRALEEASRDGRSLPHTKICRSFVSCGDGDCQLFDKQKAGLCAP